MAPPPTFIWVWRFELSFLCVAYTSPAKRFPQPLIWFWSLLKSLLFQEAVADCSPQGLLLSVFSVTVLFLLHSCRGCRGLTLYRPFVSCETMHGFWAGPGFASALWQHIMLEVWFRVAPLWLDCSLMQSWCSQQVYHSGQVQSLGFLMKSRVHVTCVSVQLSYWWNILSVSLHSLLLCIFLGAVLIKIFIWLSYCIVCLLT